MRKNSQNLEVLNTRMNFQHTISMIDIKDIEFTDLFVRVHYKDEGLDYTVSFPKDSYSIKIF